MYFFHFKNKFQILEMLWILTLSSFTLVLLLFSFSSVSSSSEHSFSSNSSKIRSWSSAIGSLFSSLIFSFSLSYFLLKSLGLTDSLIDKFAFCFATRDFKSEKYVLLFLMWSSLEFSSASTCVFLIFSYSSCNQSSLAVI